MIRTILAGAFVALLTLSFIGVAEVNVGDISFDLPTISINNEEH